MFKNFGASAQKFTFQIDVHRVVLPDMLEHFEGTESLAVSLERKNYPVLFTRDASITLNDADEIIADWQEPLVTHATMFKDSRSGLFKEKMAKLNVLQRRAGFAGVSATLSAFKSLGTASLPLHVYADTAANSTASNVKLHLTWCASEKAYLLVDITAVPGDVGGDLRSETGSVDDTRSDNGSITGSITGSQRGGVRGGAALSSLSYNATASSQREKERDRPRGVSTIREEDEKDDEDAQNDPFARHVNSPPQRESLSLSQNDDRLRGTNPQNVSQSDKAGAATSSVAFSVPASLASRDDLSFQRSALYLEMKRRIDALEEALLASQDVVLFERRRAAESAALLAQSESRADESERERAALRESAASLSLSLSQSTAEAARLQSLAARAAEEASRSAEAVRDKNDECEALLQQLIAAKLSLGELSERLEDANKELRATRAAREKALETRRARERDAAGLPPNGPPNGSIAPAAAVSRPEPSRVNGTESNLVRPFQSNGAAPPPRPIVTPSSNYAQNYAQSGAPSSQSSSGYNYSNNAPNGGYAVDPYATPAAQGIPSNFRQNTANSQTARPTEFRDNSSSSSAPSTPGTRVNPFAQVGASVGSSLLRGFNSVSSALADTPSTGTARRNPPPRPTF